MGGELQCYICNNESSEGIILLNQYICKHCEEELINTPNNQLKYHMFKKRIKGLWKNFEIQAYEN